MADFDPYHHWLGIPPDEQPPNHYRLLGVPLLESNPDVIDNAVMQRMRHLRTFQSGQHSELSQRLLNEVAAAKICLLDAEKKAEYDAQFAETAELPPLNEVAVFETPPPLAAPVGSTTPQVPSPVVSTSATPPGRARSNSSSTPKIVGIAAGGGVAAILLLLLVMGVGFGAGPFAGLKSEDEETEEEQSKSDGEEDKKPDKPDIKPVDTSVAARTPMSYVPKDALAAFVVHPKRAASSELGQALLELDVVQAEMQKERIKLDDVERIIQTIGMPSEESDNSVMIAQLSRPISREALLQNQFGDLPYEEVRFEGRTYYRYAHDVVHRDGSDVSPGTTEPTQPTVVANPKVSPAVAKVLAKYPDDRQPAANGHADSSGSGNWFYYSSRKQNPSDQAADLKELRWAGSRNRYESPVGAMGNNYPAIGGSLAPGPRPPQFAALRWRSRVPGEVKVSGNFHKFDTAKQSNGVRVLVFVDGQQKLAEDVAPKDTVGVDFEIVATVEPDSFVDFVVDPKGRSSDDSTKLTVTIESRGETASKPAVEAPDTREPEPLVDDGTGVPLGNVVYFPDDKTIISTDEQQLRALISSKPSPSPLSKKLSETDLDYDVVAVVVLDGIQEGAANMLLALAEETQSSELAGLSVFPKHANSAVVTLDLSGDQLLGIALEANNAASAEELESGIDYLFNLAEGFGMAIPPDNPVQELIKQLLQGALLDTKESNVVVTVAMPTGLVEFVKNDPTSAVLALADLAGPPDEPPIDDPVVPKEDPDEGEPKKTIYRPPPKDHPDFRDLAVGSHDCRVFFPGKPEFTEQNVKIEAGNVHVANFQGRTPRATYLFEIYTYPKAFVADTGEEPLLQQTRDNLVDAPTGRLISSEPLMYQGSAAIDFVYEHPDTTGAGKGHCRAVLRGNRIYVLEADGFKVAQAEIDVFFDSLAPFELGDSVTDADPTDPRAVEESKLPVPDEAARESALKLVQELYKAKFQEAKTDEAKTALANEIVTEAAALDDAAQKYVMLEVARKIAVGVPDVATAMAILDQLETQFDIDRISVRSGTFLDLGKARVLPNERMTLVNDMLDIAEQAIVADKLSESVELLTVAQTQTRAAREFKLLTRVNKRLAEVKEMEAQFSALQPQLAALEEDSDDAVANLAVGRFRCLSQGNFAAGLALLARSGDALLQELAELDLAAPKTPAEQIALGDKWWEIAATYEGFEQRQARLRAAHWYRIALPSAQGLEKQKLTARIDEVAPAEIAAPPVEVKPVE